MVSLCGLLRCTVIATSAPKTSARRNMASIRCPFGIVAVSVSPLGGPGCCGFAFMAFNLPPNCFRTVIEKRSVMQGLGEELATSQIAASAPFNLSFTVRSGTTRATARTVRESLAARSGMTPQPFSRWIARPSHQSQAIGRYRVCGGVTMSNRCRSLLLLSAWLVVGYPAAWLLAISSSSISAHLAPRNGVELTLYGLAVTALVFTLTLWALPA
jgi:hypothetical protein